MRSSRAGSSRGSVDTPIQLQERSHAKASQQENMMAYRVQFDFVVHFTNAGNLSARGFRLDIPGNDISDDELAACLIQDMRLLMAGRVVPTSRSSGNRTRGRQSRSANFHRRRSN